MSAELVRHALDHARGTVFSGMKQILRSGQNLEIILMLINEGGQCNMVAWTLETTPPEAMDTIVELCRDTGAVAALFVAEFNGITEEGGYRVAAVHWCYPEDGISDSCFFILDPDNLEIGEDRSQNVDVPDRLIDWLDEALEEARVR